MLSKKTVVIECGDAHVALGIYELTEGRLHLAHHATATFVLQTDQYEEWLRYVRDALQDLGATVKTGSQVVVLVPSRMVLTKLIKIPRVEPAKRAKIIRFAAEQALPGPLAEMAWDSVEVGEFGGQQEVLLVAAKLRVIEGLCGAVQEFGFQPQLILPSAFATLAAFRSSHGAEMQPQLVAALDQRSMSLLHLEGPRFIIRTLRWSVPDKVDLIDGDEPAQATEAVSGSLAQEITRTRFYFSREAGFGDPRKIWLTGHTDQWLGLAESLAGKIGVVAKDFTMAGELATGEPGPEKNHPLRNALTGLAGAAMTQFHSGHHTVNLLPGRLILEKHLHRQRPWLAAAVLIAMAAWIPPLIHFQRLDAEARQQTARLDREIAPLCERDDRNRANLQQIDELTKEISRLQAWQEQRTFWRDFLADMQGRLVEVEDVWLQSMSVVSNGDGPAKLAVKGRLLIHPDPLSYSKVEAAGRVRRLLATLAASPFVSGLEAERFDDSQPGLLQFDCVLIAGSSHAF